MKKWLASLLALALLTGILSGCGEKTEEPKETEKPTTAPITLPPQQNKQEVLDAAAALANKGDYLDALKKIEEALKDLPDDADYKTAYDNYCSAYEDSVIAQADTLVSNKDYNGAIAIVEEAQKNLKDSEKLSIAHSRYVNLKNNCPPDEYLYNLQHDKFTVQRGQNVFFKIVGEVTSFLDEIYSNGLLFKFERYGGANLEYSLNKTYSRLTGKISMIKTGDVLGLGEFVGESNNLVYFEFVGDGKVLYTSPLTNPTMDIAFDVDLTNVSTLQINIVDQGGHYWNEYFALTGLGLYK